MPSSCHLRNHIPCPFPKPGIHHIDNQANTNCGETRDCSPIATRGGVSHPESSSTARVMFDMTGEEESSVVISSLYGASKPQTHSHEEQCLLTPNSLFSHSSLPPAWSSRGAPEREEQLKCALTSRWRGGEGRRKEVVGEQEGGRVGGATVTAGVIKRLALFQIFQLSLALVQLTCQTLSTTLGSSGYRL